MSARSKEQELEGGMLNSRDLRITTICENTAGRGGVLAEWGFSAFIDTGRYRFLLDTGTSGIAAQNADRLGIDLSSAEAIVLSHGHADHTGGLEAVLSRMHKKEVPVIAHPDVYRAKYGHNKKTGTYHYAGIPFRRERLESFGARFKLTKEPTWLSEDVVACGEEPMTTDFESLPSSLVLKTDDGYVPDTMADDQSIFIRTDMGLVVILGCAHRGIINILRYGRELTGVSKIHMVIGGTHLSPAARTQVDSTIAALKEIDPDWIGVSHCTGLNVAAEMQQVFGKRFFYNTTGTRITFPYGE